jgi:hypothetical protein
LSSLNLCGTKVTNSGLNELGGLKYLTSLNLCGTKTTDSGMRGKPDHHRPYGLSPRLVRTIGGRDVDDHVWKFNRC